MTCSSLPVSVADTNMVYVKRVIDTGERQGIDCMARDTDHAEGMTRKGKEGATTPTLETLQHTEGLGIHTDCMYHRTV